MAISEILRADLSDFYQTVGVRHVKAAKKPHLCGISGHRIEPGESYHRVTYLTNRPHKAVMVCSCDRAGGCEAPAENPLSVSIAAAFQALRNSR
jgi:hypothetical protein